MSSVREGSSNLFIRSASEEYGFFSRLSRTPSLNSVREEAAVVDVNSANFVDENSYSSLSVPSTSKKKTGKWTLASSLRRPWCVVNKCGVSWPFYYPCLATVCADCGKFRTFSRRLVVRQLEKSIICLESLRLRVEVNNKNLIFLSVWV